MTSQTWPRLTALAAACAATLALLTGCGDTESSDHPHPPGDAHVHIEGPTPENADAGTAATMALTAMFSWQPMSDASTGAGLARAKPWLTGTLASSADAPPATGIRPLAEWAAWRASFDIVTANVTVDQIDGDGDVDQQALVRATVIQTVQHTDGSATPYRVMHVAAAMDRTNNGWRLASYRVTG
ncbi:hypothetical protein [Nocardia salmonicida]|uniref:hypothetical protein n=1 Tax=Nocardia salmonicida TaxID=53431 RepID=UPI0033CB5B8D